MARVKKYQLEVEQEANFNMLGISSHHSDYRLAWCLNAELNMHFKRSEEPYILTHKKKMGEYSAHPMYEFYDIENHADFYLIKNKADGVFLIPEKKNIDFFVFICNGSAIKLHEINDTFRKVSSVMATFVFYPEEIESCTNLVFN